jgi:hypothetical protein
MSNRSFKGIDLAGQATNHAALASGEARGKKRAPTPREAPQLETIMDRSVKRLLERRIRQFHPQVQITRTCLAMMKFSDRPLTERERLNVLAMCNCYAPDSRRLALLNYIGYLEKRPSTGMNLPAMLHAFRENPSNLINVFTNDCIASHADTRFLRCAITATRKRTRHWDDDEL